MKKKIDASYWAEICADPKKAKEALMYLETPKGKVEFVQLADGSQISVKDVTEKQAHDFMKSLCPEWAKN